MKCKNCGYEEDWLTGYEIEKKYGISVINVPMDDLMSPICVCGHHAKDHRNPGTAGVCLECKKRDSALHSLVKQIPSVWRPIPVFCGFHNFIPSDHTPRIRVNIR